VIESTGATEKVFIAQAADGALLIGSSMALVKQASKTGSSSKSYALPMDNAIALVLAAEAVKRVSGLAGAGSPVKLDSAGRAQLTANLDPGKIGARLDLGDAAAAKQAAEQLTLLLASFKSDPSVPPLGKPTLDGLTIQADGKELTLAAPISADAIEQGAKGLADAFKEADETM
jgi:hypothetical protein